MKQHTKYIIGIGLIISAIGTGCKKDFFNRPPENQPTAGTYYKTVAQVASSTNILYAAPWFGLNGKAFLAIGDLQGGNARCYVGTDPAFGAFANFSAGNTTGGVQSAWNSLFTVVAQSNALLSNLPTAAAAVPAVTVNNALGEAHLMRAAAYFYLVRIFGNVPIITNPTDLVSSFDSVRTNPVKDVYKFIVNDLKFAEANCTAGVANTGHASSGSASGLLAKVYLYMQDYANAQLEAEKVINSGEFGLVGTSGNLISFTNMFELAGNNCKESMIALQWNSNGGYGFANQIQSVIAPVNDITGTGDGYAELGPTYSLQAAFAAAGDSIRRHGTIMDPGAYYPELHKATGGYTVPLNVNAQGTHAGLKKYVVGTPDDNGGKTAKQATSNNTYILRYADILLIEAEAILGKQAGATVGHGIDTSATSTDATALQYFNMVRSRAGEPPVLSFSYRDLLKERRLEFAGEADYWYDLTRIDGFDSPTHLVGRAIIMSQNVGDASGGTAINNYKDFTLYTQYLSINDSQFLTPIPQSDVEADPALLLPPVPYHF
ncbi:MAG: RagB/SusD family nutrient uptake outer membrane protein [Bacteroidota bacterium]|nr:RagB/SusD family nutrient uptake outer membrane protein [Bacteroidota bacterium]